MGDPLNIEYVTYLSMGVSWLVALAGETHGWQIVTATMTVHSSLSPRHTHTPATE